MDFSISTKHKARELNADADDAIPLLCGNVFFDLIFNESFWRTGKYSITLSKKISNFLLNSGFNSS